MVGWVERSETHRLLPAVFDGFRSAQPILRDVRSSMPNPPFRADHVGSLLRPAALLKARAQHQAGHISAAELRRVEDDAIRDAAAMQAELGLQGVTDGEFRRRPWRMEFLY